MNRPTWIRVMTLAVACFLAGAATRDLVGRFHVKERLVGLLAEDTTPVAGNRDRTIRTIFQTIVATWQSVPGLTGTGGAIERAGDVVILATPTGRLGYLTPGADITYLDTRIPLNREELERHPLAGDPTFMDSNGVRVLDLLALRSPGPTTDLLVSHQRFAGDCVEFRISALSITAAGGRVALGPDSTWRTLFIGTPCVDHQVAGRWASSGLESGGRMVQLTDGHILFTTGDHEFDGRYNRPKLARDRSSTLGKLMLLDLSTGEASIYATGVRNPQGLTLAADGRIWETEHGPNGGDELNLVVAGADYGWPEVTLGTDYAWDDDSNSYLPWPHSPEDGRHEGFTKPTFSFVPSVAVSNLVEADAGEFPHWKNDLMVASLGGQRLFRVRLDGDRVVYSEPIDIGERIRDIITLADGRLALWTDAHNLIVIRNGEVQPQVTRAGDRPLSDEARAGRDVFNVRCGMCHELDATGRTGPPLRNVVGRQIGSVEGFTYSAALARARGVWDEARLRAYLLNPAGTVPGTSMPSSGLGAEEIDRVVTYLRER